MSKTNQKPTGRRSSAAPKPTAKTPAIDAAADPLPSVALTADDWAALVQLVEIGVKTAGAVAFEGGGRLLREVSTQLQPQLKRHG